MANSTSRLSQASTRVNLQGAGDGTEEEVVLTKALIRRIMEFRMVRKMRWICMAALLPAFGVAYGQFAQFDYGNGQSTDKPWTQFKLNPKTRVKLDLKNASVDAVISFFENVSGVTIVKDPALTGALPLTSAKPVPLNDAFQILST